MVKYISLNIGTVMKKCFPCTSVPIFKMSPYVFRQQKLNIYRVNYVKFPLIKKSMQF